MPANGRFEILPLGAAGRWGQLPTCANSNLPPADPDAAIVAKLAELRRLSPPAAGLLEELVDAAIERMRPGTRSCDARRWWV
jgi:hypothetical protein